MTIKKTGTKLLLSTISGLFLSVGWFQISLGWVVLFAFVPLLFVFTEQTNSIKRHNALTVFMYCFICFLIWNIFSTYWIYKASIPGVIAAILISSVLMSCVMLISYKTLVIFGARTGSVLFITNWVAFEYLFMNSQISWPWLILGNSFADNVSLIQWYEFTGHLGGSVWILIINILIYKTLQSIIVKAGRNRIIKISVILSIFLIVPTGYSLVRFFTYKEIEHPIEVVVIQPNIDPYNEKFSIPVQDQLNIILDIADQYGDSTVNYFIAPETALTYGIWENDICSNNYIMHIQTFLKKYPECKFIIGANTLKKYPGGKGKTETSAESGNSGNYFDIYNTSLQIDTTSNVFIYHKSKLVPGVEMLPYPKTLSFLKSIMPDLGGITGSHGTQNDREVFTNETMSISVGVPICYESVYGQFVTEFVQKGANVLFVITNDGWWGNTMGYRQHHDLSRLRAIETRRSIVRSANTGISCLINQKGEDTAILGWWQAGAIRGHINANDKITFYVKHGDYIARMSVIISALFLLMGIGHKIHSKFK